MDRVTLTETYLAELEAAGTPAEELLAGLPHNKIVNSGKPSGLGRWLARPVFLGDAELTRLTADLDNLLTALESLPRKLFGGDFAAFARAVGLTEPQVAAVMQNRGERLTRQSRADLVCDGTGFKLLEFNIGSAIGGMDNVDVCRELLTVPVLARFAERYGLTFVDSLRGQVHNILTETGFSAGDHPVVALTEWPSAFPDELPYLTQLCGRWRELGLDAVPCHLGQLEVRDGRVRLAGRPVDIIVRTFLIRDVVGPDASRLTTAVFEAARRGEVKIFTPLDTAAYASKGALSLLSEESNRHLFTPEVVASLDRILPWTRRVRREEVTLENGDRVDLVEYALSHAEDLVLKPTSLFGGKGVVLGWADDLTPEAWRALLLAALDSPHVLQRRVRHVLETVPIPGGGVDRFRPVWGIATGVDGFMGGSVRALPSAAGDAVVSLANGAHIGALLHETPAPLAGAAPEVSRRRLWGSATVMKAAVFHGRGDVRVQEWPAPPAPGPGEIQLAVVRAGICGTDVEEFTSGPHLIPLTRPHFASGHHGPLVIGHEMVGEVVATGPGVDTFAPGDMVVPGSGVSCGDCRWCVRGRTNICGRYYTLGLHVDGGLAERVNVPARISRSVGDLDPDVAIMAQPLAVALRAVRDITPDPDQTVVVIGLGSIGSLAVAACAARGVRTVGVDVSAARLETGRRAGAGLLIDASHEDASAVIRAVTGGHGADVVIEASGAPAGLATAVNAVCRGGHLRLVGLHRDPSPLDLTRLVLEEVMLDTSKVHICDQDLPEALALLTDHPEIATTALDEVVTLDRLIPDGLERIARGDATGKVVVRL
ncbi:zinc-binding dehydrogenase [Micromonospora sp. S-DT3-3-22]|uniref:zinc-dependent alcohol dehydrogenase n=1 Tax=Micromonospora sp. S-DT3-3-22 TaxID=2755359 RepID=UPI001E60EE1C|nr:alcohol dehydrogenase catalytic domain-containing protein [Micromonospora sp. S-DT3-3-22]